MALQLHAIEPSSAERRTAEIDLTEIRAAEVAAIQMEGAVGSDDAARRRGRAALRGMC
jgi:hypothetical protein